MKEKKGVDEVLMHSTANTRVIDRSSSGEVSLDLGEIGLFGVARVENQVGHAETERFARVQK